MRLSCRTGGKDGFAGETELSGDNVPVREEVGEARAGGDVHGICSRPRTLWACSVPATATASGRQQDPTGAVLATRPWSRFLEMSWLIFLGSRLEPFGESIGCHAATVRRLREAKRQRNGVPETELGLIGRTRGQDGSWLLSHTGRQILAVLKPTG